MTAPLTGTTVYTYDAGDRLLVAGAGDAADGAVVKNLHMSLV